MATPIQDPRELFVHQLRTMLWVELTLADDVLPELFELVHSTHLKWAVERHLLETRDHVKNLRRVLVHLEEPANPEQTPALVALKQEHDTLLKSVPEHDLALRDIVHCDAIARTEHYELAAYSGLVHLGKALGIDHELVTALRENMEQESHALEQVEHGLAELLAEQVENVDR